MNNEIFDVLKLQFPNLTDEAIMSMVKGLENKAAKENAKAIPQEVKEQWHDVEQEIDTLFEVAENVFQLVKEIPAEYVHVVPGHIRDYPFGDNKVRKGALTHLEETLANFLNVMANPRETRGRSNDEARSNKLSEEIAYLEQVRLNPSRCDFATRAIAERKAAYKELLGYAYSPKEEAPVLTEEDVASVTTETSEGDEVDLEALYEKAFAKREEASVEA